MEVSELVKIKGFPMVGDFRFHMPHDRPGNAVVVLIRLDDFSGRTGKGNFYH